VAQKVVFSVEFIDQLQWQLQWWR